LFFISDDGFDSLISWCYFVYTAEQQRKLLKVHSNTDRKSLAIQDMSVQGYDSAAMDD